MPHEHNSTDSQRPKVSDSLSAAPSFLVIGAAKSGTTSLYRYLQQHPQVYCSPKKEPSFFAFMGEKPSPAGPGDLELYDRMVVWDPREYERLFAAAAEAKAIGEFSNLYLYVPEAAERIHRELPSVRLIALLRNPVDRAFSSYLHLRRDGRESCDTFEEALQAEEERIQAGWEYLWHYTRAGYYYTQLKRYWDRFPADQIAVFPFDEFRSRPDVVLRKVLSFLQVDSEVEIDTSMQYNISGTPRFKALHGLLSRPNPIKQLAHEFTSRSFRIRVGNRLARWNLTRSARPQMAEGTRRYLQELFSEDVIRLQELTGLDLSRWLERE
jgi:hypothetical protein